MSDKLLETNLEKKRMSMRGVDKKNLKNTCLESLKCITLSLLRSELITIRKLPQPNFIVVTCTLLANPMLVAKQKEINQAVRILP